ncbi:transcription factor SFL1-like [Actinia tenebrosa]|uniref:Transcription factor SFL1-like n=1 Tax=Actinia tenebrosa TaxID=6105 RepID=A0A6P8INR5_ACTTE|nr:transcription factor SFL1-like [Actinia tenebrosa]
MNRNSTHNIPVKGKPLKPFISILKALLQDERFHRAIKWSENGNALVITDGETFKKVVLDGSEEMFKTRNFTSFVRQLNLYGFKKVPVSGKGDPSRNMRFEHQHFRREHPELMHLVQRNCNSRKKKRPENVVNGKQRTTKRACSFQGGTYPSKRMKVKYFSDEYAGPDEDKSYSSDSEIHSTSSSGISSERSTPTKEVTFNSSDSIYEPTEEEALEQDDVQEYMLKKLQEEQMAVQLLLSLRNAAPYLSSAMPISTVTSYEQAPCPYYYSATPSFHSQYNHM